MSNERKRKILVVDDERSNLITLNHILKPEFTTLVAINGRTAINISRQGEPDLILLDVIMPEMSGFEVLRELKSSDITKDIPVIIITGLDGIMDEEKGFSLGAVDYITKPFHHSIVLARVRLHLKIIEQMRVIEGLSMEDALTQIPNRRCFNNHLEREWSRAARNKTPISLLMIDVDRFKAYNDTYGHIQGDIVLKEVSAVLQSQIHRTADLAARWGGEEFAVLLPETDISGAAKIAENIRIKIEELSILSMGAEHTKVTVSIGVSESRPVPDSPASGLITSADEALYAAKNAGRNAVCLAKGKAEALQNA